MDNLDVQKCDFLTDLQDISRLCSRQQNWNEIQGLRPTFSLFCYILTRSQGEMLKM